MAAAARRVEELGFDAVWFPDSQLLWRDVYATLAAAALATDRIVLGAAVTNVGTRHASVLASAVRTVHELAPNRFVVGVGVGDSALRPIGEASTPRSELASALEQVRALVRGDTVDFGGGPMRLRDAVGPVPVYMAANGPKNLAFAGAHADGVILLSGASPAALARSLERVRAGAAAADRDPGGLDVVVSAFCRVTDDVARDARLLKPICAAIAQTGGGALLKIAGISVAVPPRVPQVYPDLVHAEDWPAAVEVCNAWISDADALAFAREFSLFGTVDEISTRIDAMSEGGATQMLLQHVGSYDLPHELMEGVGAGVLRRP